MGFFNVFPSFLEPPKSLEPSKSLEPLGSREETCGPLTWVKLAIPGAWQLLRHTSVLVFSWKKQEYFKRDKEKAVVRQIPVLLDEARAPQLNCSPTQRPHGANPGRKGRADSSASSELLPKAKTTTKFLQGRGLRQRIHFRGVLCRDPTPARNNLNLQSFGAAEANLG